MKTFYKYLLGLIIVSALLYVFNYFYLKIGAWMFTGIVLILWIVCFVILMIIAKQIQKRKLKDDSNFLFTKGVGDAISNVDVGIQYESSVLSIFCLMIGIVIFSIYFMFFSEFTLWWKVFYLFNSLCGLTLMAGMITTFYQQLISYREAMKTLKSFNDNDKDNNLNKNENQKGGTNG